MTLPKHRKASRRKSVEDRRPTLPAGLKGLDVEGPRVRTLPFDFFTHRYRPVVVHVAAYLDAMGAEGDECRWDHVGTIAGAIGFKERAVELALKTLADDGWIAIDRQPVGERETNVYWMLWRISPGGQARPAVERPYTSKPTPKRPAAPAESARTCAPTCASPSADPGLSPSASTPPSAWPCAEKAHGHAPPILLESSIQLENITSTLPNAVLTPNPIETSVPRPTDAEIDRHRANLTHKLGMIRRLGATELAALGLCPSEFLHLVNKEEPTGETKPTTPRPPAPTSTVEMIVSLADPSSPVAVDALAARMQSELNDWESLPWLKKIVGEAKAGTIEAKKLAACYAEAKRQTGKPPRQYFGRGVKSLRSSSPPAQ